MVKIRQFLSKDLNRVIEIERVSFPDPWPKSEFKRIYQLQPGSFQVAEISGKVVGYIIGSIKNQAGRIESIAVDPSHRQKGIGKNLIEFIINHFKKKGAKEAMAHVRTKNKVAIAFYQKLGFGILKTIKGYYRSGDDAYLMRKEI